MNNIQYIAPPWSTIYKLMGLFVVEDQEEIGTSLLSYVQRILEEDGWTHEMTIYNVTAYCPHVVETMLYQLSTDGEQYIAEIKEHLIVPEKCITKISITITNSHGDILYERKWNTLYQRI